MIQSGCWPVSTLASTTRTYGGSVQSLIEAVRVTVKAYGAGIITEKELPPPHKGEGAQTQVWRGAPSFLISAAAPASLIEKPYTLQTLADFMVQLGSDGEPTTRVRLVLTALELNETFAA